MRKRTPKEYLKYFAPAIFLTLVGFIVAYQFVSPAPPRNITIATGQSEGAYYAFGQEYRRILARDRVELTVKQTSGSVENLQLMLKPESSIDVAFVQGGVGQSTPSDNLVSLGSIFYEPLWVFHRAELAVRQLSDLRGMRIAVGMEGSGTKELALQLLALNDVTPQNSRFLYTGSLESAEMLLNAKIDVMFSVVSHRAAFIKELLTTPQIVLLDFNRGEAYTKRLHFLSLLKIPTGVLDFVNNIPSRDVHLLAPTAQLVAHKDFHPALTDLLLLAAAEINGKGGLFEMPGEFPAPKFLDFPLSKEAKRFYETGPPFLRRYLPFWLANFLIRMKIMLLPLLALFFPLVRLLPPFYYWQIKRRIFRWYDQLEEVDIELQRGEVSGSLEELMSRLKWIEDQVTEIHVPRGFSKEVYNMRVHIEMLRRKLIDCGASPCGIPTSTAHKNGPKPA